MSKAQVTNVRRLGALIVLVIACLLVGTSSFLAPAESAKAMAKLDPELQQGLATMTTAAIAEDALIAEDIDSARSRNLAIPMMQARLENAGRFSGIPLASASYRTASQCLAQAVYYEAAVEPEAGQRAVAQVVLNRVRHPAYPNSVCGVVYQGYSQRVCQFSFTCDGALTRTPQANLWKRAQAIANDALSGRVMPDVGTATHYHADYVVPKWAYTLGKITKIGRHIFYRFPGSPGRSASFYRGWSGREILPSIDFDRFRLAASQQDDAVSIEPAYTPGLTVEPDVKDRHALADVGGRIDTTKTWRLSIPDPVQLSAGYRSTLEGQGETQPHQISNEETQP